ncbi:hypothetical protein F5Y02DRAFT_18390 [Annulohypoxylon stygium]|nr:hypothetical protein F5Y02DRAFT_18390 [Annulohypoxylon stygium]
MSLSLDAEREAKLLIEKIRGHHSLVGHDELSAQVQDLLHLTASEFYDASTHFLLELLQNADDNEYRQTTTPTLVFSYKARGLRVDCNETGFQAKHVESISKVRRSTKSEKKHTYGYTGEKGVGFKSVFRVADQVWISSRQYHFKFDKTEPFGMIAPRWAEFPGPTSPEETSFYLKLSKSYNEDELVDQLRTFDPTLLMFLKRLKRVTLRVLGRAEQSWEETILKTNAHENGSSLTILKMNNNQLRYLTFDYLVENLPVESKRPQSSYSKIVLAFPLTDLPERPRLGSYNVYAMLPIGDYGLKFLVNADFLLTVNRLHIDISLPWNQALRDGLAYAFIQAVDHFNKNSLRHYWPPFIPTNNVSPFFQPSRRSILQSLRDNEVVESSAGTLHKPASLFYVSPTKYTDKYGCPFTLSMQTENKYLSSSFPTSTIEPLLNLGVRELTDEIFLEDLESMLSATSSIVYNKPLEWHAQLAQALLPMVDDPPKKKTLFRLPIIPLIDGDWTSADQQPVLLSKGFNVASFPISTTFQIVDPAAAAETHRRTLFGRLGILEIDTPQMCRCIADMHSSKSFRPDQLSKEELISHFKYLFEALWLPPNNVEIDLWFATSDNGRCKGSQLYMRETFLEGSSQVNVFQRLKERPAIAHKDHVPSAQPGFPKTQPSSTINNHMRQEPSWPTQHITSYTEETSGPLADLVPPDQFNNEQEEGLVTETLNHKAHQRRVAHEFHQNRKLLNVQWQDDFQTIQTTEAYNYTFPAIHNDYLYICSTDQREFMKNYLVGILNLSEIPRLAYFPHISSQSTYYLSEEFKFLLRTYPISHIIDLLHSHWKSYSPWIEIDTSTGLDIAVANSNKLLTQEIKSSVVWTLHGPSPLSQTVIPALDTRVDELEIPIPTLDIPNSKDGSLRRKMACLGITVENNIWYYILCLKSIRLHQNVPRYETISYVYEQIQARYDHNEAYVDFVFDRYGFIYDTISKSWLTVTECAQMGVHPEFIYPSCKGLFLGIMDVNIIGFEALVAKAASIDRSSYMSDILELLISISERLESTSSSKARKLLKPLSGKAIFPIRNKPGHDGFDDLLPLNATWFVADRPHLAKSFDGMIPLLAFHAQEVPALGNLLNFWNLNARRLSKLTTRRSEASGTLIYSNQDTSSFRIRSTAFKALVPKSNPRRDLICNQLDNTSIIHATNVSQIYTFKYNELEHTGKPIPGEYALYLNERSCGLKIFTTRKCGISRVTSFELVDLLAKYCGIYEPTAIGLLSTAISEPKLDRVKNSFEAEGYHIDLTVTAGTSKRGTQPLSGDIMRVPSAFTDDDSDGNSDIDFGNQRNSIFTSRRPKVNHGSLNPDRRVPIMDFIYAGIRSSEDHIKPLGAFVRGARLDPSRHLEYLGQYATSQFLIDFMRGNFDPSRHWTSDLRIRAGLPPFAPGDVSPFTIDNAVASQSMTQSLIRIGHTELGKWSQICPVYHLEILASGGDRSSSLIWSSSQLRRIQRFQIYKTIRFKTSIHRNPEDIMLFLHITNIYADPQFYFIIDPWDLFTSDRLIIQDGVKFEATIQDLESVSSIRAQKIQTFPRYTIAGQYLPSLPDRYSRNPPRRYTYTRLKGGEFRLFILSPGNKHDRLHGTIFTCPQIERTDTGPYRTLSYEWGPEQESDQPLYTYEGFIKIRKTLYTALRHLRQASSPIILWVDAICINQRDAIEKAQQIIFLPRIFQHAACTLAFISAEGHFDEAIKTLLQIRAKSIYESNSEEWPRNLPSVATSWAQSSTPHSTDVAWDAIKCFFDHTWFRRAWIVQEVALAPTVRIVCGSWVVDWNEIHAAMMVVQQQEVQLSKAIFNSWQPFMTLSDMRGWEVRKSRWNLLRLLETFTYTDSTLKRDRFFSLLGLALDGNQADFQPDYRTTTTFEEIACRFGYAFVYQGYGIQLLYRAGLGSQPYHFPSWLPDFTVPRTSNLLSSCEQGAVYKASSGTHEKIICMPLNSLAATGYLVDEIEQVSRSTSTGSEEGLIEYFQELDTMIDDVAEYYSKSREQELRWRVPVAGAKYPKITFSADLGLAESYKAFRQQLEEKKSMRVGDEKKDKLFSSNEDATQRQKSVGYASLLNDNLVGWRFVTTKRKLCGVVPGNALVGDLVSIINGADVPFLLRKLENQKISFQYRLIGGCYIHGIMLGEALDHPDAKEEMFHIY